MKKKFYHEPTRTNTNKSKAIFLLAIIPLSLFAAMFSGCVLWGDIDEMRDKARGKISGGGGSSGDISYILNALDKENGEWDFEGAGITAKDFSDKGIYGVDEENIEEIARWFKYFTAQKGSAPDDLIELKALVDAALIAIASEDEGFLDVKNYESMEELEKAIKSRALNKTYVEIDWYSGEEDDLIDINVKKHTLLIKLNGTFGEEAGDKPIDIVSIIVTAPERGNVPVTTATAGGGGYTCGTVSWDPGDNPFSKNTPYTAAVTVTAAEGYVFTRAPKGWINDQLASVTVNDTQKRLDLSYTFDATDAGPVINITTQPDAEISLSFGNTSWELRVEATVTGGGVPAYQWYSNDTKIDDATNATLAIPRNLIKGTYYYFCEICSDGADTVRSNVATVYVKDLLKLDIKDFSAENKAVTYNGKGQSVTVSYAAGTGINAYKAGTIQVLYAGNDTAPRNAGIYDVSVKTNGGTEYAAFASGNIVKLTIEKLQLTVELETGVELTDGKLTKVYDGTNVYDGHNITLGGTNKVAGDDVNVEIESATYNSADVAEADTITVVFTLTGKEAGNYIAPINKTLPGTITEPTGDVSITPITFSQISDINPISLTQEIILYGNGDGPATHTLTVTNPGLYESITWQIMESKVGSGNSYLLSADYFPSSFSNYESEYHVTLYVTKDGVPYSKVIPFKVVY